MIALLIQRSRNCVDRGRQRKNDIVFRKQGIFESVFK